MCMYLRNEICISVAFFFWSGDGCSASGHGNGIPKILVVYSGTTILSLSTPFFIYSNYYFFYFEKQRQEILNVYT